MSKVYLVDISSFIFRAYYAIPPLTTSKGFPTNACYGVITMLLRLIEQEKPSHLVCVYDAKGPTFREEIYEAYKGHRDVPPDDLIPQFSKIREITESMGMLNIEKDGFEADDLIATLTKEALKNKDEVVLVTGDKDLMQLVCPQVTIYDPQRERWFDEKGVVQKMGVSPKLITDYLGLVGDSSDNIPGVPGIGPKTASSLLSEFESLENLYKNIETMKPSKRKESLIENQDKAILSKKLATVHEDVEINTKISDLKFEWKPSDSLLNLMKDLEFTKLIPRVFPDQKEQSNSDKNESLEFNYKMISNKADLLEICKKIEKSREVAVDTETNSLDSLSAKLIGVSLACDDNFGYYIPIAHETTEPQLSLEVVLELLNPIFGNQEISKIFQNEKYDLHVLRNHGFEMRGVQFDTMIAAYLLDPGNRVGMDSLSLKYLGHETIPYESVCGKGKDQITFDQVPLKEATQYSSEDAWVTYRLKKILCEELKKEDLFQVFEEIDMPLVKVLAGVESEGVSLDVEFLKKMSDSLESEIASITQKITEAVGKEFNIGSPKQLQEILFEKLKLPPQKKTKTGYSTDVQVLESLSYLNHPYSFVPDMILKYREYSKLKSTYVDALPRLVNPKTGRLHTSFSQVIAATGRLASSDPNLQNIPIRTELGRQIRRAFVPKKGRLFLSCDYSQVELRLLAHFSEDKILVESFKNGEDIHTRTAAEVFGVSEAEVTSEMRREAKTINFGLVYGQTAFGLSQQLHISRNQAQEYIDRYFARYPGVRRYLDQSKETAREKGYAVTLFGRKRPIPDINNKNALKRQFAERIAINTPVQGTAADLIKIAMIRIYDELTKNQFSSKMILQVHDELVFEVEERELEQVRDLVIDRMENVYPIKVPLKVDCGMGKNWLELK